MFSGAAEGMNHSLTQIVTKLNLLLVCDFMYVWKVCVCVFAESICAGINLKKIKIEGMDQAMRGTIFAKVD